MPKNQSLALHRRSEAVRHFKNGCTFAQIAEKVGYAHRGTAHKVVTAALKDRIVEDIDEHRRLEVDRLDALQCEMWDIVSGPAPVSQRMRAARLIIQIIKERAKILGLYDHPPERPRMLIEPRENNPGKATSGPCSCQCHDPVARERMTSGS